MPNVTPSATMTPASAVGPAPRHNQTVTTQPERQNDSVVVPAPEANTEQKTKQLSPQLAIMARKEKALRQQAEALKAEKAALLAKEKEYSEKYLSKESLSQRAKQDALGLLSEFGITPDEFTQQLLNANPNDHVFRKLEAKIQALEDANKQTANKIDEQNNQAYDQAVRQIRTDAKLLIDSKPEFETIKSTNSQEAVVELIKQTFEKDGHILSVEDAAKEVENYLVEESLKLLNLKKIKEKIQPTPVEQQLTQAPPQKQAIQTLTHAQSTTTKPKLSEKDRIERAKLAFMGQLK